MSDYSLVPFTNIKEVLPVLSKISLFGGLNDEELYFLFSIRFQPFFNGQCPIHFSQNIVMM